MAILTLILISTVIAKGESGENKSSQLQKVEKKQKKKHKKKKNSKKNKEHNSNKGVTFGGFKMSETKAARRKKKYEGRRRAAIELAPVVSNKDALASCDKYFDISKISYPLTLGNNIILEDLNSPLTENELKSLVKYLLNVKLKYRESAWSKQILAFEYNFVFENTKDLKIKKKLIDKVLAICNGYAVSRNDRLAAANDPVLKKYSGGRAFDGKIYPIWSSYENNVYGFVTGGAGSLSAISFFGVATKMIAETPELFQKQSPYNTNYLKQAIWAINEFTTPTEEYIMKLFTEKNQKKLNIFVPYDEFHSSLKYRKYLYRGPKGYKNYGNGTDFSGKVSPWNRGMTLASGGVMMLQGAKLLPKNNISNELKKKIDNAEMIAKAYCEAFYKSIKKQTGVLNKNKTVLNWPYGGNININGGNTMGHAGVDFYHNYVVFTSKYFKDEFLKEQDMPLIANLITYNYFAGINKDGSASFCAKNNGKFTNMNPSGLNGILFSLALYDETLYNLGIKNYLIMIDRAKKDNKKKPKNKAGAFFVLYTKHLKALKNSK